MGSGSMLELREGESGCVHTGVDGLDVDLKFSWRAAGLDICRSRNRDIPYRS